jgi:hypothetical protein
MPIEVKTFSNLKRFPELIHGMSTRKGGHSNPPFDGLNLGLSTADDPDTVRLNRRILFEAIGMNGCNAFYI